MSLAAGSIIKATDIIPNMIQAGTVSMSFASAGSATQDITFDVEFDTAPVVMTNINSGAGTTSRWDSRAFNVTTSGFRLFVYKGELDDANQAWSGVEVQWIAMVTTQ